MPIKLHTQVRPTSAVQIWAVYLARPVVCLLANVCNVQLYDSRSAFEHLLLSCNYHSWQQWLPLQKLHRLLSRPAVTRKWGREVYRDVLVKQVVQSLRT